MATVKNESEKRQNKYFFLINSSRARRLVTQRKGKKLKVSFFPCSSFLSQGIYYYFLEKATQAPTICFAGLREIKLEFGQWGIKAVIFTSIPEGAWLDLSTLVKDY